MTDFKGKLDGIAAEKHAQEASEYEAEQRRVRDEADATAATEKATRQKAIDDARAAVTAKRGEKAGKEGLLTTKQAAKGACGACTEEEKKELDDAIATLQGEISALDGVIGTSETAVTTATGAMTAWKGQEATRK